MNQKELVEIRRRLHPERSGITHIYGCYVNSNREIISSFDESVALLGQEEAEKYIALLKKALSGALGRNLMDISFSTKQVIDSEEHRLLTALRKSGLEDETLRDSFFRCVAQALDMEDDNYLILLGFDTYDVPHYGKDGAELDSGEVFKYLICSICPVKPGKPQLGYVPEEKRFHFGAPGQVVAAPALGFMYPAFDDRSTNIYNALFYSKSTEINHQDFIDAVFRTPVPMPAGEQRENFREVLAQTMDRDCTFDMIRSVHDELKERIALHKESRDPEPLEISVEDVGEILERSGMPREKTRQFVKECESRFGEDAMLRPSNIIDAKSFKLVTPEVKITVDPQYSSMIKTKIIDGRKYILIPADSGVELNGIDISIDE